MLDFNLMPRRRKSCLGEVLLHEICYLIPAAQSARTSRLHFFKLPIDLKLISLAPKYVFFFIMYVPAVKLVEVGYSGFMEMAVSKCPSR